MLIKTQVKAAGKRDKYLMEKLYQLEGSLTTVEELITALVRLNVDEYNKDDNLIPYLTSDEIQQRIEQGEISFEERKNDKKQKKEPAVENALLSFEDGLYLAFLNGKELEFLNEIIDIKDGDTVLFIKLVMLSGRLW